MTPEPDMDLDDNDTSNWSLTNKLRVEDPEQFHTLVRMHLSFVLDLNTDETDCNIEEKSKFRPLKWSFTSFSKKMKNSKSLVESESVPLTQDILCQINLLIEYLSSEENIIQEGIFRKSGSTSRQQELKNLLGQGNTMDLSGGPFSVHDCASILKCYLAELPEPVLLELYYPAYCQIADTYFSSTPSDTTTSRLLRCIQLLLLLLPLPNYSLFQKLIRLLHLTGSHANQNRMSSNNLATLFTPHLLCPRKLSPETLHTSAAVLSKILVFMIDHGTDVFLVPDTLATDVKAYWAKKERKLKSPVKDPVNDSIMDSSAVNTVFTFVDREKTAQENTENATEAALAQLYAYIQALPESSKKRRLVKQFNKENGHGTPAVVARLTPGPNHHSTGKHFSDSIKKHIFSKGIRNKLNNQTATKAKTKLTLDHITTSTGDLIPPSLRQTPTPGGSRGLHGSAPRLIPDLSRLYTGDPWAESSDDEDLGSPFFATPSQRLVETMLTPRSRKPVVALSGTNLCTLATFQSPQPLPPHNDDLLTATVDLSCLHDSLSDSMIRSLDEETEGTDEKGGGRKLRNTLDGVEPKGTEVDVVKGKDPTFTFEEDCLSKKTRETRGEEKVIKSHQEEDTIQIHFHNSRNKFAKQEEPWDGGVSNSSEGVHSESRFNCSAALIEKPNISNANDSDTPSRKHILAETSLSSNQETSPLFILNRVKTSGSNLFSRKLSSLELNAENQNQSQQCEKYPLKTRDNFHSSSQINSNAFIHKQNSLGSAFENRLQSNPQLRKENSLCGFATLFENGREIDSSCRRRDEDIDESPPSTAPSRKRSSQNNNNEEGEVKRCLRESDVVSPLSETAL